MWYWPVLAMALIVLSFAGGVALASQVYTGARDALRPWTGHAEAMAWHIRRRTADALRVALGSVIVLGFGWVMAAFVPLYEVLLRDGHEGRGVGYLPWAQVIAWAGIVASVLAAVVSALEKVRDRRPIAWTPLIAVPLILESWLVGFLLAVVLVSY